MPSNYKWIVLSNTTIGMLLATINSSILLIAPPDIFRGIHIDSLGPGNTNYLLWMIMSYLIVTAVLVVSRGRTLGPAVLHHPPAAQAATLTGRSFLPHLMTAPFSSALSTAFTFSFRACLVAAGASWLRSR